MQELISWLFGHLYFVVVILFALFSVLNKNRKTPRGESQMPSFGGKREQSANKPNDVPTAHAEIPSQTKNSRRSPFEERQSSSGIPDSETSRNTRTLDAKGPLWNTEEQSILGSDVVHESAERSMMERKLQRLERQNANLQRELKRVSASSKNSSISGRMTDSSLDTKDLRSGIIWAEILGPPRSKKPYRSTK